MYRWLINNKYVGSCIANYRAGRGIPLQTKLISITVLWVTISLSAFRIGNLPARIFLLIVAIAVTVHLIRMKTLVAGHKTGK